MPSNEHKLVPTKKAEPASLESLLGTAELSTAEVAELSGCGLTTVRRNSGFLGAIRRGRALKFPSERIRDWLAGPAASDGSLLALKQWAAMLGISRTEQIPDRLLARVGGKFMNGGITYVDRRAALQEVERKIGSNAGTIPGLAEIVERVPSVILTHVYRENILVRDKSTTPWTLDPISVLEATLRFWPAKRAEIFGSLKFHQQFANVEEEAKAVTLLAKADTLFSRENYLEEGEVMERLGKYPRRCLPRTLREFAVSEFDRYFYPVPAVVRAEIALAKHNPRSAPRPAGRAFSNMPEELRDILAEQSARLVHNTSDENFLAAAEIVAAWLNDAGCEIFALAKRHFGEQLGLETSRVETVDSSQTMWNIRLLNAAQRLRPWLPNFRHDQPLY